MNTQTIMRHMHLCSVVKVIPVILSTHTLKSQYMCQEFSRLKQRNLATLLVTGLNSKQNKNLNKLQSIHTYIQPHIQTCMKIWDEALTDLNYFTAKQLWQQASFFAISNGYHT